MARSKTGQAIRRARRRPAQLKALDEFIVEARLKNDLGEWRRGRAVRAYIDGRRGIGAHGPSDMPVWGLSFQDPGKDTDQEAMVRHKIRDLVAFIESVQDKGR